MARRRGDSTRSVHGEDPRKDGPVAEPVVVSSTFGFADTDAMVKALSEGHFYTRWGNPTLDRLAGRIAALEGGEAGMVSASGMGAISTAVLTFLSKGDRILSVRDLYGQTHDLFAKWLPARGFETDFVPTTDVASWERSVRPEHKILYLESPTNPTLRLVDLDAAARFARRHGMVSVIDNTFATPVNQRPIEHGIDVVVHSATKYLGGHSDVVAGAIVSGKSLVEKMATTHITLGPVLDPDAAYRVWRGVKTLAVRVRHQNASAQKVAEFLAKHPKVTRVNYPGLPTHPQHALAKRQMKGFTGVLSFDLDGGRPAAIRAMDRFRLVSLAPSLGSVETLCSMPTLSSHIELDPKILDEMGISDGTVRLSIGLEDPEDIIEDLASALS
ncbi:MAG: trans-sulfuration enzyme family protein [Methanobacteriota archaeon]